MPASGKPQLRRSVVNRAAGSHPTAHGWYVIERVNKLPVRSG